MIMGLLVGGNLTDPRARSDVMQHSAHTGCSYQVAHREGSPADPARADFVPVGYRYGVRQIPVRIQLVATRTKPIAFRSRRIATALYSLRSHSCRKVSTYCARTVAGMLEGVEKNPPSRNGDNAKPHVITP